jgi:hypothetical protein
MMAHQCHALRCKTPVPPKLFMCRDHWYMVPKSKRDRLWALYRPGQEITKDPSPEYLEHAMACVRIVAEKEEKNSAVQP